MVKNVLTTQVAYFLVKKLRDPNYRQLSKKKIYLQIMDRQIHRVTFIKKINFHILKFFTKTFRVKNLFVLGPNLHNMTWMTFKIYESVKQKYEFVANYLECLAARMCFHFHPVLLIMIVVILDFYWTQSNIEPLGFKSKGRTVIVS